MGPLRRAAVAYGQLVNSSADKVISMLGGTPSPPPPSTPSSSSTSSPFPSPHSPTTPFSSTSSSPTTAPRSPLCFSATSSSPSSSTLSNAWHWLGYSSQPDHRRVFWLDARDDASAFRVLDDRPFGGRTEATARVEERRGEDGQPMRVLVYEGYIHPLPPFAKSGSRWKEDVIRPPRAFPSPSSSSSPSSDSSPPSPAGPTGLTTPTGMLNGFSSITSPAYSYPDLNLSAHSHLAFLMTTDGRPYTLSIRCKERLPLVYQARIPPHPFSPHNPHTPARPLHWKTIPFSSFLTTFQGRMRTLQLPLPKGRVASWGVSVNGPPGPFRVEVAEVWARRGLTAWEERELGDEERERWERDERRGRRDGGYLWFLTDKERARFDRRGKSEKEADRTGEGGMEEMAQAVLKQQEEERKAAEDKGKAKDGRGGA